VLLAGARKQVAWLFAPPAGQACRDGAGARLAAAKLAAALRVVGASQLDSATLGFSNTAAADWPATPLLTSWDQRISAARLPRDAATIPVVRRGVYADRGAVESQQSTPSHRLGVTMTPIRGMVWRWWGMGGTLLWSAVLLALLAAGAVYPVLASASRTANFALPRSLDGTAYMATDPLNAGDAAAIAWLDDPAHVSGDPVIVEATGGEYSHFGRVSAFTGLPTIMGWSGHEWQWRATWLVEPQHAGELERRLADINAIYTNPDPRVVLATLARYHVRYLYIGAAERSAYSGTNLNRFSVYMRIVFQRQGVTIYQVV
jgi:hypothetical protein